MCSFTVFGGSGGSENQSVSGVTTICLMQCNTSPSHRVDQVVDCGLWNVGPLLFNGCAKLLDIGRNWNTLSYTPIQSIPNNVQWVCWPCKNWDVFSFQELCTDPYNMGPCIIMLQHEVKVVDEWHNNGPQDLVVMVGTSLRLIPAVHPCSVSVSYTWWFVFILSSAAACGGAISANSQHCVLHQPRTCYSFPLPIYSRLCLLSVSVCHCVLHLTLHVWRSPLFLSFVLCPGSSGED